MKKLDKIFKNARRVDVGMEGKLVIMSDCHRGTKDNFDNFLKNHAIYDAALDYYYENGFTYIELGDGDEMWEVKNYDEIVQAYIDTFRKIRKFYLDNRFIMIYGNHDIAKRSKDILRHHFYTYYDDVLKSDEALLEGLAVYEALVLNYVGNEIFLLHGHQADFLNGTLWRVSRFLVRYVWKTLERIGLKDPTSAAKNYRVSRDVEKRLKDWSVTNNKILIAGHTHRPIFPVVGESLYFNDGSCIHPNGITCIEIEKGQISLVKWEFASLLDELKIKRSIIEGTTDIRKFYKK